jgi:hypothetical protein
MIPIDDQITALRNLEGPLAKAAADSIQRLKAIDAVQVPEEPTMLSAMRMVGNAPDVIKHVDTLRDRLKNEIESGLDKREQLTTAFISERDSLVERAEAAEAKLAAAEENVSELMAEAFDRTLVAWGHAVSAAEDNSPQRVEAPHFKEWANRVYGDVRPCDIDRIEAAFTAGAKAAEATIAAMLKLGENPSEEMKKMVCHDFRVIHVFTSMFAKLIEQAGVKK